MMKLNDFLNKLELAYNTPNYYLTGGWGKWNGSKWGWDCVCLIKGILWGWNNDTSKPRGGGALYASNGVPDIGTEQMINVCKNVSSDFSSIQIGELVWMSGHVGIFLGNNTVIECTCGWNERKIIKSQIDSKGNRTFNGKGGSKPWKKHGFLPYIEYEQVKPQPVSQPDYWTKGDYTLINSKCIRRTPSLGNNIIKVKECTPLTKSVLTSTKPNDNAMISEGTTIGITKIVKDSGKRLFGQYGNCYVCLRNIDGTPQAYKN